MSVRWTHIITNGLPEDEYNSLLKKYTVPTNCALLAPAVLNAETQTVVPTNIQRKDDASVKFQTKLGIGLSALGIQTLLSEKDAFSTQYKDVLLPCFLDAGRLLTALFFYLSLARRSFIYPYMNKNTKDFWKNAVLPNSFLALTVKK